MIPMRATTSSESSESPTAPERSRPSATVCGLAVLFLALSAAVLPSASVAGPRAVVHTATVDLGSIAKGAVIDHFFEISNEGDAPLLLTDSRSTCGCTVLDFDREIAPKSSGRVRARIDTRTVNGPAQTNVLVQTNDSENPELHLVMKIDVQTSIGVHPPRARWDTVETETVGTVGTTLFALDAKPFIVTDVELSNPDISATFRPATDLERIARYPGDQWRIELTLDDAPTIGAIEGFASVVIDHEKQKLGFIPVSGFVRPLIYVAPDVADLGRITLSDKPRRAHYEIRNFGSAPMKIKRVEMEGVEGVSTSVVERVEGHTFDVFVHFDPAKVAPGEFAGQVVVHTDLAKRKTIPIDIRGSVVVALESDEARLGGHGALDRL